ncbi:MAG TPA: hypothetical protein VEA61_05450 [Allosphingosinicella sp.]|nr:hypothetical protein [Allosphingosinicella sp.]
MGTAAAFLLPGAAGEEMAEPAPDPRAQAVLEPTRGSHATYGLRILDPADERLYAVDQARALVASEILPRDSAGDYCVPAEPVAVERTLPPNDMFSVDSLGRSFAAQRFSTRPAAATGDLWLGSRRCV